MDSDKYNRTINLLCPTCGNDQLETQEEDHNNEIIRCPNCDRTMTKDEIIRENGENIDANVGEIAEEAVKDLNKEIKNMFKNAFRGSKNIKFK